MSFLDLIIIPLWETWGELVYPDAQEMLENLSKTREFWHDKIKCTSPPLSENEPEGEDPSNIEDNEHPVEGASTVVVMPKTIAEHSSMDCNHEGDTCPVESRDDDTCSLQSSTDSLANLRRYISIKFVGEGEREGGREREYSLTRQYIICRRGRERERERIENKHCLLLPLCIPIESLSST